MTVRLPVDVVAWLDSWGPKQRSWAIESTIVADPSYAEFMTAKEVNR